MPNAFSRRSSAAALSGLCGAIALPLLFLALLLSSATGAHARRGKRKHDKPDKPYCSSLERNCNFGGNASWERNSASFVLETPAGGGDPTCTPVFEGGPAATCRYDPSTATLSMKIECFSGAGYAVVQQACGPIVEDDQGLEVLDPYVLPAPNQNQYENAGYCGAEVEPPLEGEPVEWFVQVFCAEFEEDVPADSASAAKRAAPRRPAVASFEQSARGAQARAAAKAAAAAAAAAAATAVAPAAGK
jgi:hypothetical protein